MQLARVVVVVAVVMSWPRSSPAQPAARRPPGGLVAVDHPGVIVPEPGTAVVPPSRILYLNDCKPAGCRIVPGDRDDSRRDQSAIIDVPKTLSPYAGSPADWDALVACVRDVYADFTIRVVTDDPGDVPHYEAYVAGLPRELGYPDFGGVASFSCGIIPDAVSFSFVNLEPHDIDWTCWIVAQESAHNFGLSHSMLAGDAMTYLRNPPRKRFVDESACIGTQGCCQPEGECRCALVEQNSHLRLLQTFGRAGATPPDILFDEPGNGTTGLLPGFTVRATVTDWDGVTQVELLVDEVMTASLTAPPYVFATPTDLAAGTHTVTVRATDGGGLTGRVNISVGVIEPCHDDDACAAVGPGRVCDDGRCVIAPPAESSGCGAGGGGAAPFAALLLVPLLRRRRVSESRGSGPRRRGW